MNPLGHMFYNEKRTYWVTCSIPTSVKNEPTGSHVLQRENNPPGHMFCNQKRTHWVINEKRTLRVNFQNYQKEPLRRSSPPLQSGIKFSLKRLIILLGSKMILTATLQREAFEEDIDFFNK